MADSSAKLPCASPGARIEPGHGMFRRRCRSRADMFGHA